MILYSAVLLLLLGGAVASLVLGEREKALDVASGCVLLSSLLGFLLSVYLLFLGEAQAFTVPVPLPLGTCSFSVDSLALVFLVPVFLLSGASALLLPARMRLLRQESPHSVRYGRHCFFYCILVFAIVLVLMAADSVFFLISWELMSLTPFFLISPADRNSRERHAMWIYLVAAHLGALVLIYLFASLCAGAGSTDFALIAAKAGEGGLGMTGLLFVLALVGFGVKAGLVPLHIWMPEAYSSAPGHVAVLLSGAMVNLGIYGIVRVIMLLGMAEVWWAYTLMGAGAFSGILGILMGLAQTDIKRTLAYSSAENMGIVTLALGAGLLAGSSGATEAMALLLAGALLHMWNHSIFKSLLFISVNALKESTHDTHIHQLGGLQKRLPVTGSSFAVGSAAIAGVPPLNGFMSELLLYMGFAVAAFTLHGQETAFAFWGAFFILGSISGLAVFTFTRTYGLAFLGEARSPRAVEAVEPDRLMRRVMLGFALLCFVVPLVGPALYSFIGPAVASLASALPGLPGSLPVAPAGVEPLGWQLLWWYAACGLGVSALGLVFYLYRRKLVRKNGSSESETWGCGYLAPSARVQYTAASYSYTLTGMLATLVRSRVDAPVFTDLFPSFSRATVETPDWPTLVWERVLFRPVMRLCEAGKVFQSGLVNIYVLYIVIALVVALVYALEGAA
ncbi:hypothetical protein LJC46_05750 [Desulfovibrio sp. OttesenSCG-928-G15]|nr:hypothetical protein [Desulfovibrio sp. OttesenSCG-928-G15]